MPGPKLQTFSLNWPGMRGGWSGLWFLKKLTRNDANEHRGLRATLPHNVPSEEGTELASEYGVRLNQRERTSSLVPWPCLSVLHSRGPVSLGGVGISIRHLNGKEGS